MNGLMKSNLYASLSNAKAFAALLAAMGIFVVAMDNDLPTLLIGYMLLSMVGFAFQSIASLRRESASKWGKYKLTAPVRRRDIVRSCFISLLMWLAAGVFFAAACVSLSILLHGFPFDLSTDILMLFTVGICVSLLMGAFFFPLFYFGGEERNEAVLAVSLLCAAGVMRALISGINWLFGPRMTFYEILLGAAILLAASLLLFVLSYPLSVGIFERKEY